MENSQAETKGNCLLKEIQIMQIINHPLICFATIRTGTIKDHLWKKLLILLILSNT